jgi:hypothetical protein
MIYLQIAILIAVIYCWVKGGGKQAWVRDILVPVVLGLYLALKFKAWWLFPACGATFQAIRIGYGAYSPEDDPKPSFFASITHDRSGEYIRAIWGLMVAGIGALPLLLGSFLGIWVYIGYVVLSIGVNYSVSKFKLPVTLTDILVGGAVGILIVL